MILSLFVAVAMLAAGTALLYIAKHTRLQENNEKRKVLVITVLGYVILALSFLLSAVNGAVALNSSVIGLAIVNGLTAVAAALLALQPVLSGMSSDIQQGYPSN